MALKSTEKRRRQRERAAQRATCESKVAYPNEIHALQAVEYVWNEFCSLQEPYVCPVCIQYHLRTVRQEPDANR